MGLKDFSGDGESGGSRKYYRISQEEFEGLLESVSSEFHIIGTEEDSNLAFSSELVYGHPLGHEDLQMRLYSTINEYNGRARDKGDDAIRTVIWSKSLSQPIGGRTKTLRIETWKSNLAPKIESVLESWEDRVVECDDCGGWMVKRDGKHGEFFGCAKYPACKNTENITKLREAEGKDV